MKETKPGEQLSIVFERKEPPKIKIHNKARAAQINNFSGLLRVRGIYPTDIDGLIDYGGMSFVYMEGKTITAQLKKGQKMALENVVNSHNKAGNTSVAIIYRHNTRVSEDIQVKSCFVSAVFFGGEWTKQEKKITVLQFLNRWEQKNRIL